MITLIGILSAVIAVDHALAGTSFFKANSTGGFVLQAISAVGTAVVDAFSKQA